MNLRLSSLAAVTTAAALSVFAGCGDTPDPAPAATGGSTTGGMATGGSATGGATTGGSTTGGTSTGGSSTGGSSTGGSSTGGAATGGAANGGAATGGGGTGGQGTGGVSGGSSGGGGASGGPTLTGGGGGAAGGSSGAPGGGGSGGSAIPATFDTLKLVITDFQPTCAAADCHSSGGHNVLKLSVNDQLYMNLTSRVSVACGNIPVVSPGNPEQSALIKMLKGPCGETPRMPAGCIEDEYSNNCVPDEYIAAIEQWIANGAPQ